MGIIEVDMFSEDVDDLDNAKVIEFKELLKEVAHEHACHLVSFHIEHGTVSFSFDDDELTAKILKIIQIPHSFVPPQPHNLSGTRVHRNNIPFKSSLCEALHYMKSQFAGVNGSPNDGHGLGIKFRLAFPRMTRPVGRELK